ncbi:hypothetical protein ABEB36_001616 [Hypothenemus hampei]|uniref:ABC transporter domain-containing protein n=1 Tax=Hypothenemus hampei TaxID=57062 RepID=A0ABD1FIB7_HYPHA
MIPMMYISSYMFQVPSSGYTKMTFVNITTGCVAFLLIQILSTPDLGLVDIGNTLHWIFLIVPHYSLGTGIRDAYSVYFYNNECSSFFDNCKSQCNNCTQEDCFNFLPSVREYCENLDPNYYKWESPGIGRNILFSVIAGFIFLILVFMIEHKLFSNLKYRIQQKYFKRLHVEVQDEDQDVQMEKCVIRDTQQDVLLRQYNIVIKDLTKYYKSNLAVNGLCLGIKNSECFGLLGINGAGKTTTFKMLTGDVKISSGDAWVRGRSIKSQLKEMQKLIGYCPQFDALLDDLTARETLRMFALLRGIPESDCDKVSEKLAADFDYLEHLNKQVKELSGGNKRKLSTSIALIGDPPVIYLDEPTTGMDPETKRYLFNALCRVRDGGKTIILTSHSMEECEALCTRLAVMVNGIFKCLGSTQHLKSRFAEGYTLIIKVKKPKDSAADLHASTEEIKKFVCDNFQKSELREEYEEMLTYYVTDKSIPWSKMFGILEKGKQSDLNIEDYSLCQSSLEQVFLTFTRQQNHVNDEQSP